MRILVLGGTRFLTYEIVRSAVARGHEVTCVARGQSGPPPAGARLIEIDRSTDPGFGALDGSSFDAVVDPSSRPSWVRGAVRALGDRVDHWTYVSSCSVYRDEDTPGQTASAPVKASAAPGVDESDMEFYGELKMACEDAVRAAMPDRALICRPGLIVGPRDRSGRFTYWPERLADGGDVLAPGDPQDLVQVIDVRDLAEWLVASVEAARTGTYDATSQPTTRAELLDAVAAGVGAAPRLVWVDQAFLVEHGVEPWMGPRSFPLWLPLPEYSGFMARDVTSTIEAGLALRSFADTARDTLAWSRADPDAARTGLTRDEEAELLAAWQQRDASR